jgi:hypothetical protein
MPSICPIFKILATYPGSLGHRNEKHHALCVFIIFNKGTPTVLQARHDCNLDITFPTANVRTQSDWRPKEAVTEGESCGTPRAENGSKMLEISD